MTDVSRRATGAAQDLLRLLIESVTDYAIFVLDADGTVRSWNPGAERLKGYTADEIIGQHFSRFYTEADLETRLPWRALERADAEGHFQAEGWRRRKDGSLFWADVTITPLREDGRLVGFAKVTRDLTARKRSEDALREAVERERQAVARREELDRMKDELAAVVAHELRGPIGIIRGFVDLLLADWTGMPEDQKVDVLGRISDRATGLGLLVDDIFDVTGLDAGQLRVNPTPTDVAGLVARLVADAKVAWPDRRIAVRCDDDLPPAMADEQRSWQVLNNLVSNAVKFSPADRDVDVEVVAHGGRVVVRIHDRGPGIPSEEQGLLFQRFSRLPQSGDVPGSGMGLYIARRLAQAQGAELSAAARPGGGTTFSYSLEAVDPTAAP